MPTQPPLPPLLAPYVTALPTSSLTVLSTVLGAQGNWLTLRYLYAALNASTASDATFSLSGDNNNNDGKKQKVVLVSFLRGWEFWRSEAKRLGLDLARLTDKRQFAFIDGLSELFSSPRTTPTTETAHPPLPSQPALRGGPIPQRTVLPTRSAPGPIPARGPQPTTPRPVAAVPPPSAPPAPREVGGPVTRLHWSSKGAAALDSLEKDIAAVVAQLKAAATAEDASEVLLLLDQPDLLLAATGPSKDVGATEMSEWVMGLQQYVDATVMTLAADLPLIHNASAAGHQMATPLETEHAAFAIGSAHRAHMVMQLRDLDTGAARDVSGVLRVSKGGAWGQSDNVDTNGGREEREVLYFVQRDGGVSVFGRGE
ncbi:uncharacterized protein BP01DRAFT_341663 [Aspergillus saccharolyticus JOP 1030-1]|uniref:Elongator complex protein 6 n=1 Tax=Aspergillus saccharolyticus JOP 1030-1 TaxID=1450539 RepID=A0A318ZBY7_9EURO|nr:hypothetical protein BP01DRAFT_341663 [Aspergillus saccharolyticus JOP 1030-1]PYH44916.1 hypothetical protein BP01DRAFT_341663 [Aspergillus saccharolyticus JOP 1030-1]